MKINEWNHIVVVVSFLCSSVQMKSTEVILVSVTVSPSSSTSIPGSLPFASLVTPYRHERAWDQDCVFFWPLTGILVNRISAPDLKLVIDIICLRDLKFSKVYPFWILGVRLCHFWIKISARSFYAKHETKLRSQCAIGRSFPEWELPYVYLGRRRKKESA